MPSRPLMLLGNIIAITVTIAALFQALSWPTAGILILASLIIPLLASYNPTRTMNTHPLSKSPSTTRHLQTEAKPQHNAAEKHSVGDHSLPEKMEQKTSAKQAIKPSGLQPGPKTATSTMLQPKTSVREPSSSPMLPQVKPGPNYNPTIRSGDYVEYEVEIESGKEFSGEVSTDGLVNVYLLDEENLDNLDEGEEFWSETGEESVENAKLEFTAPSKGTWFFVVENADDRPVSATVKILNGRVSTTH